VTAQQGLGLSDGLGLVPEGCTPADAQVLRTANHSLAAESHALQSVLADLLLQVNRFVQREGEADFETGPATAVLRRLQPGIDTHRCQNVDAPHACWRGRCQNRRKCAQA
jgi:hypothetical protein